MEWKWNSSSHPISDIRDWNNLKRIEIKPDFQRGEVWAEAAKIMLMDSILRNIPMPKIFFQAVIKETETYRIVIDGQQRLKAILSFLKGEFKLDRPYEGEHSNLYFQDLPKEIKDNFLAYKIDVNEIINADEEIVREIYARVNKYTIVLNKQELRRADFPGDFLKLSEELAVLDFLDEARIFTVASRRRMGDIEFASELIALLIDGIQDKKENLDQFYQDYAKWDRDDFDITKAKFKAIVDDLKLIFTDLLPINKTRFKQKADFYSLFSAIYELQEIEGTFKDKDLVPLQGDLLILDHWIEPESSVNILSEYAIKCVSQGNTLASRRWRSDFLKSILIGTYCNVLPNQETRGVFQSILYDINNSKDHTDLFSEKSCPICETEIEKFDPDEVSITWSRKETLFQLSNAVFMHNYCFEINNDYFNRDEEC